MTITVDGTHYAVAKVTGAAINLRVVTNEWKIFRRMKNETDAQLQQRVVAKLQELREVRSLAMPR